MLALILLRVACVNVFGALLVFSSFSNSATCLYFLLLAVILHQLICDGQSANRLTLMEPTDGFRLGEAATL